MKDKRYVVQLRVPLGGVCVVTAASAEVVGEHLVFLNSEGKLVFLFLLEIIESWLESDP
jgi:hypothetical protein